VTKRPDRICRELRMPGSSEKSTFNFDTKVQIVSFSRVPHPNAAEVWQRAFTAC